MAGSCSKGFLRSAQAGKVGASASLTFATTHHTTLRHYHGGLGAPSRTLLDTKGSNQLQGVSSVDRYRGEEEEEERKDGGGEEEENPFGGKSGPGYLPFPPPFHTINIIMILIIANVLTYFIMMYGSDDTRDFLIDHFTLSRDNWTRIYPIFTNALYQENFLQIAIDCYLLYILGDTILNFLGNARTTFLAALCIAGGGLLHIARQELAVHYGCDELEARGRCYGPNTFIMGLISLEGLIFRHLNFLQQPPVPFLVLTALVMVIDVWRLLNMEVDEHGAATGGALMAYVFLGPSHSHVRT
ncbi:serine peptidase, Clan S-, family S54 [Angomonas deanei]|uniref:Rhomboid family, putative n=1 Tax=Angomonas deanei TaxID=59799 RepID=A0A7G2CK38_9TRYP|nr:serine peptidase, Clan S-, family S54 [Angomonas deanei]CAD2220250.1 Rhomboid family, putative [Angomonas deanei]|eukprot:EPY43597.1 serine peptidase, Clan S-, family S54 [Angomonas deanei]